MIRSTKDFWAGLIYLFFGLCTVVIARDYDTGTALRMGPAYFPMLLGYLLTLIGIISVVRSFISHGTPIGEIAFKGLLVIIGSVLLFGFLVRRTGLLIALPLLVSVWTSVTMVPGATAAGTSVSAVRIGSWRVVETLTGAL